MVQSKSLWLFGLAATTASATQEFFYGKNGLSKLHINKVVADKNCGCAGSWNHTEFPEISRHFGEKLDKLIPVTTSARGHKDASPLSIGHNTYTLSLDYSSGYIRPNSSDAAIWSRVCPRRLYNLTLTVYGDKGCVNRFDPCVKAEPADVKHKHARDAARVGPAIDWSDKEAIIKHMKLDVYNTSMLDDAVMNNKKLPQYIYHDDLHTVIDTATIKPVHDNSTLQERQYNCIPYGYYSYWGEGMWNYWGDWVPVSSCLWTGLNPNGGSVNFNVGFSMSYAQSWNWGWSPVNSAFGAQFSFTVTESYSQSFTYGCNIPGNSVGQIWAQQQIGAGYVYRTSCISSCGRTSCNGREGPNYAGAPASGVYSIGCSTGAQNMRCGAYQNNWHAYNVWSHTP